MADGALDQAVKAAAQLAGVRVLFCARPFNNTLLLRQGDSNLWDLPRVGQFDYRGDLEPLDDTVMLARVNKQFIPPRMSERGYMWPCDDLIRTCSPEILRFDGAKIMARLDARSTSATSPAAYTDAAITLGENHMGLSADTVRRMVDDAVAKRLQLQDTPEQRQRLHTIQARWAPVAAAYGDSAASPLAGEGERDFRVRLAARYQKYSRDPKVKGATLAMLNNSIDFLEDAMIADALHEAAHPSAFQPGVLKYVSVPNGAGVPITHAVGDPNACWDQFNPNIRYVRRMLTPGTAKA